MSFVPVRCLVDNVTNAVNAEVTTTTDHGYETDQVVRLIVPPAYGMDVYEQTRVVVTGSDTFVTEVDTSSQLPFVPPAYVPGAPAFTQAQCVPITGVEQNIL